MDAHDDLLELLCKKTWNALRDYQMINEGDHVLIGLSGGKDSLALVRILALLSGSFQPAFRVSAIHITIKEIPYQADIPYLTSYCTACGVPLTVEQASLPSQDEASKTKNPCFICSWTRRKLLFENAQRMHCTKIALGHHQDDVIETFLMNQVFQGSLSTIPPKLTMHKFPVTLIRPFYTVPESELQCFAEANQFRTNTVVCPYEKVSHRTDIKQIIRQFRNMNPQAAQSLFKAMSNIQPEYLPPPVP